MSNMNWQEAFEMLKLYCKHNYSEVGDALRVLHDFVFIMRRLDL
jgi:hypothetical protein